MIDPIMIFLNMLSNRFSLEAVEGCLIQYSMLKVLNKAIADRKDSDYLNRKRKIGGEFFITADGKLKQKNSDD